MSYDTLLAFHRETAALAQVAGRLGWDQETMMPAGAAEQRAEEAAALEGVLHARRTDPRLADWLAATEVGDDRVAAANLRLIRRDHDRAQKIPPPLARELARTTSRAHGIWAAARAADDVAAFLPILTRIVALKREEATALADGANLYDALLDEHEPGTSAAWLTRLFDRMRPRLVTLRERVLGTDTPPVLQGDFPAAAQLELARDLATRFGYDWNHGRLDLAVHPFSSGSGQDVRITTRVNPADPFDCIYSTIHEVGHAIYEQNINPAHLLTPLGTGVSMGVHESQSRICENQLGRSRAFTGWLFGRLADIAPLNLPDPDAFHAAVNRVAPGYIRTEADELHYNLHIMLRFDLEQALIAGDLLPADLEAAWNDRFKADFGVAVDRPANGMLQDVHWAAGLFGYFPTYALGNVYAGCLHRAMRNDLPDLDTRLAAGDPGPAIAWLAQNLQRHGALRTPHETVARACRCVPDEVPLLDYLDAKFTELYRL